jgi:signal transduction histidine kinase
MSATEDALTNELADLTQMQALANRLLVATDLNEALGDVLECAMRATHADFGTVQIYDPHTATLSLANQRGFGPEICAYLRSIRAGDAPACALALTQREYVVVEDVQIDPRCASYRALAADAGFRAVQCAPMRERGDRILGILSMQFREPHRPSEREQRFHCLYARQAAGVVERFRSDYTLRQQTERLRLLCDATAILLTTDEPDAMLQQLFGRIAPPLGMDCYLHYSVGPSGDELILESHHGIGDEAAGQVARLQFGQTICGSAAQQRSSVVATHIQQSPEPAWTLARSLGVGFCVATPLLFEDRLIGILSFASRTREELAADELEFLQTICSYVTVAAERLRLVRELREADCQKNEFLAMLGHELRNPLTPLRNAVLLLKLASASPERTLMVREMIGRQVQHLVRLVDDLLDIGRIMRGKITLRSEPLELATVINQAVETIQPNIDEQSHVLVVSLPPEPLPVHGDPVRLTQVFGNLLHNAAKYTPAHGRIELVAERRGDEVVVTVRDNGVGISPDMQAKVFDLFVQADPSLERTKGGLGIGLTLVKRLVELHHGHVTLRSGGPGQGSEFTVRLPLSAEAPGETSASVAPPVALAGGTDHHLRILVVDDNPDILSSLSLVLREWGHVVHVAHDGPTALVEAVRYHPQLVLLDLGLPGMSGYQVAERLHQHPDSADAVVVAMTGYGRLDDRLRAKQAGFAGHLVKPVEHDTLARLLASIPTG